jgi:hypothetical protein
MTGRICEEHRQRGVGGALRKSRVVVLGLAVALLSLSMSTTTAFGNGPPQCPDNTIASNFEGTPIPGGDTIWFNAVLKASGVKSGAVILFRDQTITFSANGKTYVVHPPNSLIRFSTSATQGTGLFDVPNNQWEVTVPASFGDNVFLGGEGFVVPAGGLPGGINPVTWTGDFSQVPPGASINWQWGAAVYNEFGSLGSLGVKWTHSTNLDEFHNGDQAGTPEHFRSHVVGGARGGGGSNFTGSYSSTGHCPS